MLKDNSQEKILYKKALDFLCELHKINPPKIAIYNHHLLLKEVMLFVDWYLKYEKKIELNLAQKQEYKRLWLELFDLLDVEKTLVLRDFHADNLMLLKNEEVGLLDFQDAVIGSKSYDLVSLLEDARRDIDENLSQEMLNYFLEKNCDNKEKILQDYEILSLQRNIKILGIFARLAWRDDKKSYLDLIPRVKKYIVKRIEGNKKTSKKLFEITKFIENFL